MHQQVRVTPVNSPPDLQRVLQFLADEPLEPNEILDPDKPIGVNLVAAGGSRVELGGQFAFVPYHDDDHDHAAAAQRALDKGDYGEDKVKWYNTTDHPQWLRSEVLEDSAGELLAFVARVKSQNGSGWRIKDILVGTQRVGNTVPVQIFSVPIDDPDQDQDEDEDD
jgi:hypothetical protein